MMIVIVYVGHEDASYHVVDVDVIFVSGVFRGPVDDTGGEVRFIIRCYS
jgi:hypothetical protein